MKRTLFALVGAMLLLLTACNTNTPSAISVKGKIYKHPTAVQYLKFKADSVQYYGDFGNETLNNQTFAYSQKDEVVTVYTPTPEHLLAYEGFVLRNGQQYELFADTSDPSYQDHQPTDPATFSLVGKKYVCDDEWEQSPSDDHYWAWVLNFYDDQHIVIYQTPNRDLSYHIDYLAVVDSTCYECTYPTICFTGWNSLATMIDTTHIMWRDLQYTLHR